MIRKTMTVCLIGFLAVAGSLHAGETFKAQVVNVGDGDTIGVLVDGSRNGARCDAPE